MNNRMVEFICVDCKCKAEVSISAAHRVKRCPACRVKHKRMLDSLKEKDRCRYRDQRRTEVETGGPYQVIFDPWDSFGRCSSFTKSEILDMLRYKYLANGTRFQHISGYVYHILDGKLMRAGKAGVQL